MTVLRFNTILCYGVVPLTSYTKCAKFAIYKLTEVYADGSVTMILETHKLKAFKLVTMKGAGRCDVSVSVLSDYSRPPGFQNILSST